MICEWMGVTRPGLLVALAVSVLGVAGRMQQPDPGLLGFECDSTFGL